MVRQLQGDALPLAFTLEEVRGLLPTPSARITGIVYEYPTPTSSSPTTITATNTAGESRRLQLVG